MLLARRFSLEVWQGIALGFSSWTLIGLFDASHSYLKNAYQGSSLPWCDAVASGLWLWYAWGLLALGISCLVRYYPIAPHVWLRRLALYAVVGLVVVVVKVALDYPVVELFFCPLPGLMSFRKFLWTSVVGHVHTYLVIYWAIVGVCHARNFYRQSRERELRASQLEARLTQAQLQLLRAQLHPHFLFNTLNAVSALVHRDVEVADRMLARLGDLLRLTLDNAGTHEVALREELEFIQAYLEIEQVRLGSRLHVEWAVDAEVLDDPIPYLLLQPIVENAVKHGVAPCSQPGQIVIAATRSNGRLRLEVQDNGPGLSSQPAGRNGVGIGLKNTQSRLDQLYGAEHLFRLENRPEGGLRVIIEVPREDLPLEPSSAITPAVLIPQQA